MAKKDFKFPQANQPGGPARVNVNPADLDDVTCEKCGNWTFNAVVLLKNVPAVVSPEGKPGYLPNQVFACNACGHVNSAFVLGSNWFSEETLKGMGAIAEQADPNEIEGSKIVIDE